MTRSVCEKNIVPWENGTGTGLQPYFHTMLFWASLLTEDGGEDVGDGEGGG